LNSEDVKKETSKQTDVPETDECIPIYF